MLAPNPQPESLIKRVLSALRPPAARPFSEMGVSGISHHGGYVATKEKSTKWVGAQRYVTIADMAVNASIVATGVHYFLNLIAQPKWAFEPVDKSAEAKKAAELVQHVIESMTSSPWSRVVRRAGLYRFYGFSVQEWTAERHHDDGHVGLHAIESRPQSTINRWAIDTGGHVEGAFQVSPITGQELGIPRSKMLYLRDDVLSDSPEGIGIFRHLAESWERLQQFYALETRGFERDLRGTPVGRVPYTLIREAVADGALTQAAADTMIEAMERFVKLQVKQSDTAITLDSIPYFSQAADGSKVGTTPQWGLELLQGDAAGIAEVSAAITRTQTEMARLLTCEHLMMGESAGNRSLSEDKSRNLYLVASAVLGDIVAGTQLDIVPRICDLNGVAEEHRPVPKVEDIAFKDAEAVASTLAKMAQAGAVLQLDDPVIEDVRNLMGVSPPAPVTPEMLRAAAGEGADEGDDEVGEDASDDDGEADADEEDEDAEKRFDPDQPRHPRGHERGGQWADDDGGEAPAPGDQDASAIELFKQTFREDEASLDAVWKKAGPELRALAMQAEAEAAGRVATNAAVEAGGYMRADGTYTLERQALHARIIAEQFTPEAVAAATPSPGEAPSLVMSGGRPASGKTSALRGLGLDASRYIYVSADTIQEKLPGYKPQIAGLYNPEGQDIALQVERVARESGLNVMYDATMKSPAPARERVKIYKDAGYDVAAYFIHTSPQTSAGRSLERFKSSGRYVPPQVSLLSRTNEITFDALKPDVTRWALYDNNGSRPRLVGWHNLRS